MKKFIVIAHTAFSSMFFAGHPLNTDDAYSIGKNNFEIEFVAEVINHRSEWEFAVPIALSYGLIENLDLSLITSHHKVWDNNSSQNCLNDLFFEVKYIFWNDVIRIGVKPFLSIPVGQEEKGFGKGKVCYGSYILLTKEWETFHIHTQFGYSRNNNNIGELPDLWEYSIALEKLLSEKISAVFEFGISRNSFPGVSEHPTFLLGGFMYELNENLILSLGLMKGLNQNEANYSLMSGLTFGF